MLPHSSSNESFLSDNSSGITTNDSTPAQSPRQSRAYKQSAQVISQYENHDHQQYPNHIHTNFDHFYESDKSYNEWQQYYHHHHHHHNQYQPPHPQQQRLRQLPCRTFLSCGTCPYGPRCVFLHDYRLEGSPLAPLGTIRRTNEAVKKRDEATDALYWPQMKVEMVSYHLDERNLPLISQQYIVPKPKTLDNDLHVSSVAPAPASCSSVKSQTAAFSVWNHFTEVLCRTHPFELTSTGFWNEYEDTNVFTGRTRLPIFMTLSQEDETDFSVQTKCENK